MASNDRAADVRRELEKGREAVDTVTRLSQLITAAMIEHGVYASDPASEGCQAARRKILDLTEALLDAREAVLVSTSRATRIANDMKGRG